MTGPSMRTEAALLTLVLSSGALAQDGRFELAVPAEVTLVGLTFGVRPELLFRPGEPGSVSQLRLAFGVLGGPDQLFLPLSLGYRAQFRRAHVVQPAVGVGLELQHRLAFDLPAVTQFGVYLELQHRLAFDLPAVTQFGVYLELGVGFAVSPRVTLSAMFGADLMLFGGPGFGFGPRLAAGWRF